MGLIYKQGDLLEAFENGEVDLVMHICNCEGLTYFKGIAKTIHEKYPELLEINKLVKGRDVFGKAAIKKVKHGTIVNIYAQLYRGQPSNKTMYGCLDIFPNRLFALETALQAVKKQLRLKDNVIGIPLLLSGLAASKEMKSDMTDLEYFKEFIAPTIEKELGNYNITIYYL